MQLLIGFFVFISLSGNPASSCEIKFDPPQLVVRFGDPIVANCSYSSCTNVEGMGWETTYGGGGLKNNVAYLPLIISKVTDWNPEPQCYITFSDDQEQRIKTLPITVYKIPASVSLNDSQWGPMVEGRQYSLRCDAVDVRPTDKLSVIWHKGNKIYKEEKYFGQLVNNATSVIQVKPNRGDDGSDFWCEVKLNLWPAGQGPPPVRSKLWKITVKYPPTFAEPHNETLEMTPDANLTLSCKAAGNPRPFYSWGFAPSTEEAMENQDGIESILTPEESGIYSCTASNELGQTTKHFTVAEAQRDRTAFAAILGGFIALGAVLFIAGLVLLTPNGTFALPKPSGGVI